MDIDRFIEKAPFSFDVDRLKEHIQTNVIDAQVPGKYFGNVWGGWGLWNGTGDPLNGFEQGTNGSFVSGMMAEGKELKDELYGSGLLGLQKIDEHHTPTFRQIKPSTVCFGYLQEVMEQIKDYGLYPSRSRLAELKPKGGNRWHSDSNPNHYIVRLHIPVFTNEKALFWVEDPVTKERGSVHLPADGSAYFVRTNIVHRVTNDGDDSRYHVFMDVTDDQNMTKHNNVESFKRECIERGLEPSFTRLPTYE